MGAIGKAPLHHTAAVLIDALKISLRRAAGGAYSGITIETSRFRLNSYNENHKILEERLSLTEEDSDGSGNIGQACLDQRGDRSYLSRRGDVRQNQGQRGRCIDRNLVRGFSPLQRNPHPVQAHPCGLSRLEARYPGFLSLCLSG